MPRDEAEPAFIEAHRGADGDGQGILEAPALRCGERRADAAERARLPATLHTLHADRVRRALVCFRLC